MGPGIEALVGALLSEGGTAEQLYRDSIAHLDQTRVRAQLARAHLLGKVFTKLGISSRSQLEHVLLPAADAA
jgi:hypothetical protein